MEDVFSREPFATGQGIQAQNTKFTIVSAGLINSHIVI